MMNREDMMALAVVGAFCCPAFVGCAVGLLLAAVGDRLAGVGVAYLGIAAGGTLAFVVRSRV